MPVYQTARIVSNSAHDAASQFNLQTSCNVYSRLSNPSVAALEEGLAATEGGQFPWDNGNSPA